MVAKLLKKMEGLIPIVLLVVLLLSACSRNEATVINTETIDDLEIIDPANSLYITWPDIYGAYAVFANYNPITNEKREIHLFNIITKEDEIIYSAQDTAYNSVIEDVRIGNGWVFWNEGHWPAGESPIAWTIKAYNIQSNQIRVIRSSTELLGEPSLAPRVDNENNTIVWLEGYTDSQDNLVHTIYSYNADNDTTTKVTDVSHVENPYAIVKPRNNCICFSDYIDNRWVLRIIDLGTKEETVIETSEYPQSPCSDGEIVIWIESIGDLYYMNINDKNKIVLEDRSFLCDIYNGNAYYSVSHEKHHIYKYNVADGITTCLTKSAEEAYEHIWFEFYNFNEDKMICIFNRKIYDENGDIKDTKYVLTVVSEID